LSPLQAAAVAIDVHNSRQSSWSKALLDNAARPSGAIVYKGADGQGQLSADQYDRLVSEMEAHHQGARNAGRPMLLEGGLDWKPMGFSPSDMEFQKTKEAAAREIAIAFGVPPMLLGIPGDATYANYQEANRAFYRLTVLPLATRVTAACRIGCRRLYWARRWTCGPIWIRSRRWRPSATSNGRGWRRRFPERGRKADAAGAAALAEEGMAGAGRVALCLRQFRRRRGADRGERAGGMSAGRRWSSGWADRGGAGAAGKAASGWGFTGWRRSCWRRWPRRSFRRR
jgi:hypothetical protein